MLGLGQICLQSKLSDTLSDRIQRLSVEIGNLEGEALQDASSAEILGTLAREARI